MIFNKTKYNSNTKKNKITVQKHEKLWKYKYV